MDQNKRFFTVNLTKKKIHFLPCKFKSSMTAMCTNRFCVPFKCISNIHASITCCLLFTPTIVYLSLFKTGINVYMYYYASPWVNICRNRITSLVHWLILFQIFDFVKIIRVICLFSNFKSDQFSFSFILICQTFLYPIWSSMKNNHFLKPSNRWI